MTLGDLTTLCCEKIAAGYPPHPSQLSGAPETRSHEKSLGRLVELIRQYRTQSEFRSLLMDEIFNVYCMLYTETGRPSWTLHGLYEGTPLPPRTNRMAEKLRQFSLEIPADPRALCVIHVG